MSHSTIFMPLSRRTCIRGITTGLTALGWSRIARAQPAATGELRARAGTAKLRGETQPATPIWGFDGASPGPLLRVKRGDEFSLRVANDLPEAIAIHWQGMRIANAMD